jgi:tetratricopeptide (TPR) repeat protein
MTTGLYDAAMNSLSAVLARRFLPGALALLLSACTPQQMLLNALLPDGTASVLLGNLQGVPDANRQRIAALEQQGDWAGLAAFAEENIAKDPFSAGWRMVAGYAYSRMNDYPRASAQFSELVRLAPDDATGYHLLAEAQRAGGQPARAVATLERALLVLRESAQTYQLLGAANSDLERYVPASAAYRKALELEPGYAEAWFGLGRASLRLARRADAQEALRALEQMRSPRAAELRAMMGG